MASLLIKQKDACSMAEKFSGRLWKSLAISGLVILVIYLYVSSHPCCQVSSTFAIPNSIIWNSPISNHLNSPTSISHLVFGMAGSSKTWSNKRWYIEAWWRPNQTRGYVFLDKTPTQHLPWPPSSPPFRISEDNARYDKYHKHGIPFAIRMVRVIEETFKAERRGVRWYVMADDDTVLFIDNLVEVLSKYDHRKYFYIGMNSGCIMSNLYNSFEMAFGGAGYALSYPLAKAVAKNMDMCIKRYPTLFGSDRILQSCIADLGVSLTKERGFHQIDFHGDISSFLSAHPQSPFLSIHHTDAIDPIFPLMNRAESVNHLMKAAKVDHSRLLQQSVCYQKQKNWTFSVSWGYTVQIYQQIIPPSILHKPIATFTAWKKGAAPPFMFDTRLPSNDTCEAPHVFFFASAEEQTRANHIVTSYTRRSSRVLPACSSSGNHSAQFISEVHVLSPTRKFIAGDGSRRECCDVVKPAGIDSLEIKLRACLTDEIIA